MPSRRLALALAIVLVSGCSGENGGKTPGAPAGGSAGQPGGGGAGGNGAGGSAGADAAAPPDPLPPTPVADGSVTAPPAPPSDGPVQGGGGGGDPSSWIGGPSRPGKFMLFEGFEGVQDGKPDPMIWSSSGGVVVDSMHAARGTRALHVLPLTKGSSLIRETRTFPALAKAYYARIFLWVDKQPPQPNAGLYHWTVIEGSDNAGGGGRVLRLGGHIENKVMGANWLRFNYNTHVNGETGKSDLEAVLKPKTWHCLEAYFDMTAQEARFWLDNVERPALHWKADMAQFPFPADVRSLSFGWAEYQVTPSPFEVWIDEIAIDAQPIHCEN
jgi:hypothetical protein